MMAPTAPPAAATIDSRARVRPEVVRGSLIVIGAACAAATLAALSVYCYTKATKAKAKKTAATKDEDGGPARGDTSSSSTAGADAGVAMKVTAIASINVFMWGLFYSAVIPMLPFYAREYHFSQLGLGFILAALQGGFVIGESGWVGVVILEYM